MSQITNQLKWCLNDKTRLKIISSSKSLALKHFKKSEKNFEVLKYLEKQKYVDWALSVGFYAVYHCFLTILANNGFQTKNQTCTIVVMLNLIKNKKIDFDEDLVLKFDTLEPEKTLESSTLRNNRELSTYGVETSITSNDLKELKDYILRVQKETIKNIL